MSWSVNRIGPKDVVRPLVEADFAKAAEQYNGTLEADDVRAAGRAALACIDEAEMHPFNNALKVECHGSRSKGYVTVVVNVSGIRLDL